MSHGIAPYEDAAKEIIDAFSLLSSGNCDVAIEECRDSTSPFLRGLGVWIPQSLKLQSVGVFRALRVAVMSGEAESIIAAADDSVDEPWRTIVEALKAIHQPH
jgi:hypothetical protein